MIPCLVKGNFLYESLYLESKFQKQQQCVRNFTFHLGHSKCFTSVFHYSDHSEPELTSPHQLAVDKSYHAACPKVLYRANDDRRVFPKIYLDEVDHKHLYVAFQNQVGGSVQVLTLDLWCIVSERGWCVQVKRVPVSTCSSYTTLRDCWSAQDPYCVWCSSKNRLEKQPPAFTLTGKLHFGGGKHNIFFPQLHL